MHSTHIHVNAKSWQLQKVPLPSTWKTECHNKTKHRLDWHWVSCSLNGMVYVHESCSLMSETMAVQTKGFPLSDGCKTKKQLLNKIMSPLWQRLHLDAPKSRLSWLEKYWVRSNWVNNVWAKSQLLPSECIEQRGRATQDPWPSFWPQPEITLRGYHVAAAGGTRPGCPGKQKSRFSACLDSRWPSSTENEWSAQ